MQGVSVSVAGAPVIFDRVRVGSPNFEAAFDASLVVADLGEEFEGFVVAVGDEGD